MNYRSLARMHLRANPLGQDGDYLDRWIHLIFNLKDWREQGFLLKWDMVQTWERVIYETTRANDYEWLHATVEVG
jgi:hypothetical protein